MKRTKFFAIAIAMLLSVSAFAANDGLTFTTIDNPGDPTFNQLLGIDKSGVISGYFGSGAVGHPNQGYTIAPPYTKFVSENLPGSTQTQVTGISSNGTTVGFWAPTNLGMADANFGFIREANGFTYLSVNNPLGASFPQVDQVLGINAAGIAVGFYNDANNNPQGYAYSVKTGVYTPVNVSGQVSGEATGINSENKICGFFTTGGVTEGFVQTLGKSGVVTIFTVPGAAITQLLGINDKGLAVGFYQNTPNDITHGITYNPVTGDWNQVDDPSGAQGTVLNGVNDNGQAVGFYIDAAGNFDGMLVNGVK